MSRGRRSLLRLTQLLQSHIKEGRHVQALALFTRMRASGEFSLDPFVFPLALKSCTALALPLAGSAIQAHAAKAGLLSSPFVASALVDFRGKCISASSARQLFDESPHKNVVVWNTMISAYCRSGDIPSVIRLYEAMDVAPIASTFNSIIAAMSESNEGRNRALDFYRRMQVLGLKPNLITLLALLPVCASAAALNPVKEIHGFSTRNNIYPHPHLSSGLVESYGRCGLLSYARSLFDEMPERDLVSWSAMLSAYAFHGEADAALSVLKQMESTEIRPDGVAFLGLLKACSHAGLADEAVKYFELMRSNYGEVVTGDHYSCLVDVLSRSGRLHEAYEVIRRMPAKASAKAWGALLGACRSHGEVGLGEIAGRILFEIEPDNAGNFVLLASIYSSAGKFEEAGQVRKQMIENCRRRMPGCSWVV